MKKYSALLLALAACSSPKNEKLAVAADTVQPLQVRDTTLPQTHTEKPIISSEKTPQPTFPIKIFQGSVGVMIYPSDKQIDSLQAIDSENFMTAADDNLFYMSQAKEYLEMIHTPVERISADTVLVFKNEKGQTFSMNMRKQLWSMIIFDGIHAPKSINITDVRKECEKYYAENKNKQ